LELQTSEKVYLDLQLEVRDRGGHSARPVVGRNAIYRLARALLRVADFEFPVRLNETTRAYFQRIALRETPATAAAIRAFLAAPDDSSAAAKVAADSPVYNALLRTTAVATTARAGHAANALPQMAQAVVNCRILPGESPDSVQETLRRVVADTSVHVTRLGPPKPSPPTPLRADVLEAMERVGASLWPGVMVLPVMSMGASDGVYLRRAGMPVYGISGMFLDMEDVRAHGRDERIGVREYYEGIRFLRLLVDALALRAP
ncbi:MAG TPA: M20/M25/M40 family metallo-hydrolase, partial [Bacteroidota bacterium]